MSNGFYSFTNRGEVHEVCEVCGRELEHGEDVYEAEDGGFVCEDCIDDYLDEWKSEHKVWLRDATHYGEE